MLRDPESWKELDQGVRGDTSTKLQVGITSAALSLATHLSNFTKSYVKDKISESERCKFAVFLPSFPIQNR